MAAALLVPLLTILSGSAHGQQRPPTPVRVEPVRRELVQQRRQVLGEVRAAGRSLVATEEPGLVVALLVREGDAVEAGALLCRLDGTRLELELAVLDSEVAVDQALLEQSRLEASQAQRNAETLRELAGRAAANPKELADAETTAQVALARVAQREQALVRLAAQRRLLEERLEDLGIRAPFAGVVVRRDTDLGQWLAAGDPVVALVSSGLEAWLDVPQGLFAAVSAHAGSLRLEVDATGDVLELDAYRIVPDVDPAARAFSVVAPLSAGSGPARLAPGMSLTGQVATGERAERLTLPMDAVLRNDAGTYVFAALGGGEGPPLATPLPVTVAYEHAGRAVLRGETPAEGTLVVVEGNERLMPMMPLAPRTEADAAASGSGR